MRRIARPLRAIDSPHVLCSAPRQSTQSPCTRLCSPAAAFSTTPGCSFLLPGKQDKKKHQQFVRRWQKRLLGDSEPIGAHVDPYDPTSPVRIAPEEQGEYEEVLDDDGPELPSYAPAGRNTGLLRVGGKQWRKQKQESQLAREFEKLTQRTYTPLTLNMANDIEELTGTPYTLKDENLIMAQTVHHVTGRPYTDYNFGLQRKTSTLRELRSRFAQAVAEVYTLKQAGLDMDLSKLANRGIYEPPRWVKDIKLSRTESGQLVLAFPQHKSVDHFLQLMQTTPVWESSQAVEMDELVDEAELTEPTQPPEQLPVMDPDTPEFKREAVVKIDPENKPFDFMSNRPVPRAVPVEEAKAEEDINIEEPTSQPAIPAVSPSVKLASAVETSRSAVSAMRLSLFEHQAQRLAGNILALSEATARNSSVPLPAKGEDTTWRLISIADNLVKFALFKRLLQLTGIRIADPQLTSANTLGDLYASLCTTAKPQPTSLFSSIHVDGQKARERAKQQVISETTSTRRANLGDLINLGNVELRRVKRTKSEERTTTGLEKVVNYALMERNLGTGKSAASGRKGKRSVQIVGKRKGLAFEKPISSTGANFLAKKTRERKDEALA